MICSEIYRITKKYLASKENKLGALNIILLLVLLIIGLTAKKGVGLYAPLMFIGYSLHLMYSDMKCRLNHNTRYYLVKRISMFTYFIGISISSSLILYFITNKFSSTSIIIELILIISLIIYLSLYKDKI